MEHLRKIEDKKQTIKSELLKMGTLGIYKEGYIGEDCKICFPNEDPEFIREILGDMQNSGLIIDFGNYMGGFKRISFHITDYGIFEYEKDKPLKKLTNELIILLQCVSEKEGWFPNIDFEMINNNSLLNKEQIGNLLYGIRIICDISGGIGGQYYVTKGRKSITEFGLALLQQDFQQRNMFLQPYLTDSSLLLTEFEELEESVSLKRWKSAFVSMTAILEYCITDWGIHHHNSFQVIDYQGGTKNYQFSNKMAPLWAKLKYLIEDGCHNFNNIGNSNDWLIVDAIFRPYRNFVHIKAMQQANVIIDESQYRSMRPIFDKLVKLF